eukprot:TRINITY_DN166_c0_g1_i6.p1 TRINITY_DN166_c0_g1~~TRINITY_DN166_c0_g1_i6.p1  ORF type:complete len:303 (+),score=83.54 TRINITY_DN166_c0_g1_i6:1899-2807(+)
MNIEEDSIAAEVEQHSATLAPYAYICSLKGKQLRKVLIRAFNHWLKVPADQLAVVEDIVESLHAASLMIDDIEDNTAVRRGQPAAHVKFGEALTINSANFVYFLALQKCLELQNEEAVKVFCNEMVRLHQGQGMDIYWREQHMCPSLERYKQMVSNKTGGLLRLFVRMMQALVNDTSERFSKLVDMLGILYQIRDDYVNLISEEYGRTRGSIADDLTEGKFSFPIIHAILFGKGGERLSEILKMRTADDALKLEAVKIMEDSGSFKFTRNEMTILCAGMKELLGEMGGNDVLFVVVEQLGNV